MVPILVSIATKLSVFDRADSALPVVSMLLRRARMEISPFTIWSRNSIGMLIAFSGFAEEEVINGGEVFIGDGCASLSITVLFMFDDCCSIRLLALTPSGIALMLGGKEFKARDDITGML